jgi:hypothetical protein
MNVHVNPNDNRPVRDDVGPRFERLLRQLDNNDDRDFDGRVEFGRRNVLSDHGAQRLGQSLLRATARNPHRQFRFISISPYYMTADADQYSALLEFFATGQCGKVMLCHQGPDWPAPQPPGMLAAMERIVIAMMANQQPAPLAIVGLSLTMPMLRLTLQCRDVTLYRCRMESPLLPQISPNDTTNYCDDHSAAAPAAAAAAIAAINSPERGIHLHLVSSSDWVGILQAATALKKTNVTSLALSLDDAAPIVGRLDLSSLIGFVTSQPNSMDLYFQLRSQIGDNTIVEHIVADILNHCPGVHSLVIRFGSITSRVHREQFPRLLELVSDSALTRLAIEGYSGVNVMSREQEQQMAVVTQRNIVIPVYLRTTHLLKPRRPPVVNSNDPPIVVVYANDGEDRRKHQFLLSHALSQAAVHPIFFSHVYEFVRNHGDQLFGPEDSHQHRHQRQCLQQPPHNRRFGDSHWCSMM